MRCYAQDPDARPSIDAVVTHKRIQKRLSDTEALSGYNQSYSSYYTICHRCTAYLTSLVTVLTVAVT